MSGSSMSDRLTDDQWRASAEVCDVPARIVGFFEDGSVAIRFANDQGISITPAGEVTYFDKHGKQMTP